MGRKFGSGLRPPFGEVNGVPSNTKSPGPRSSSIPSDILIHAAISPQHIWAENWGVCCAPLGRGSWVPVYHNVARAKAYSRAKFHLDPSNRLATVHQRYRQTGEKDGQDRQDRTGRRSDSIGRTVLQTLAQKRKMRYEYPFWAAVTSNGSPYAMGPLSCLSCM